MSRAEGAAPRAGTHGPRGLRVHGGPIADELAEFGLTPGEILDFSSSVDAYGPCPAVVEAVRSAPIDRYPDPAASTARRAIAAHLSTGPDRVVLGAGAADLLWTLARALLAPGETALIVEPTFSEFRAAAASCGARVVEWRAGAADGFAVDLEAVSALVAAERARAVYLCRPNNPTGTAVALSAWTAFAERHADVALVLDEAYLALSERSGDAARELPDNVVRVRSLTKEHAIPGVRVGYALVSPDLAARIEGFRPAWSTSAAAQAAAVATCAAGDHVAARRARLLADRDHLAGALRGIGLEPSPSVAAFLIVEVGSPDLRGHLLREHRILVRDCASFGLPGFLRLAARPASDVGRLVDALATAVGEGAAGRGGAR